MSITYPANNGTSSFVGTGNSYNCTGCGAWVNQMYWTNHMQFHTEASSVPLAPISSGPSNDVIADVLARLRRLEDYVMNDEKRFREEMDALKSVLTSVRDQAA